MYPRRGHSRSNLFRPSEEDSGGCAKNRGKEVEGAAKEVQSPCIGEGLGEARETQPIGKAEEEGVEEDVGPAVEHGAEEAVDECMVGEEHGAVAREWIIVVSKWLEWFGRDFGM